MDSERFKLLMSNSRVVFITTKSNATPVDMKMRDSAELGLSSPPSLVFYRDTFPKYLNVLIIA